MLNNVYKHIFFLHIDNLISILRYLKPKTITIAPCPVLVVVLYCFD